MKYKNNPFNIRVGSRWIGLSGNRKGFCEFQSLEFGVRAACILLLVSYRRKGICRLSHIISRFAPSSENDTSAYIDYVSLSSGIPKNLILTITLQYAKVLSAMAWYETNTRISVSYVLQVISKYNILLFNP